jgi:putative redox protein
MNTSEVVYLGDLRTEATHLFSGAKIITDAPLDNEGKAEAFSPTDIVATAYASCMITIMGIYCKNHGLNFEHAKASITKIMAAAPRRIGKIVIDMDLTNNGWSTLEAEKVIHAGKMCPVAKSMSDDLEIEFEYKY